MSTHIVLGPGAEFDAVSRMVKRWGSLARGIGDDAALLSLPRGEQLVASTDAFIDGVHFKDRWLTPREIGYRAVTAALSDLAAMAATPLGVLISLQLTRGAMRDLSAIADGIGDAVKLAKTLILGGNISRADTLGITTTVLGHVFAPLARSGARPGDFIYVTGALGGPSASVRSLLRRKRPTKALRDRFARPAARITEARWLATHGAVAGIDISDGLLSDIGHLAAASNVRIEMDSARVPVMKGATLEDALRGGEEYELLIVTRSPAPETEFYAAFRSPLTLLGRVREGTGVTLDGKRVAGQRGHDHFSRR